MQRDCFFLPDDQVYMCGHSLGPAPRKAAQRLETVIHDWNRIAVRGWEKSHWFELPQRVGARLAPLIGAQADEVMMCDSTSVNLFKVLKSALRLNRGRTVILTQEDNFPADLYIAQGISAFDERVTLKYTSCDQLLECLDESVAVLMLTHTNYRDASVFNMKSITQKAQQLGILVVWDLAHSAGIVPLALSECQVDFAVGCTYKYLSAGPGGPGYVYVNRRHHQDALSPIFGWIGHANPFVFQSQYQAHGASKYLGGSPSVLSLSVLESALDIFEAVDMYELYQKNREHVTYLTQQFRTLGLHCASHKSQLHGGHIAVIHPDAYPISRALIDMNIQCDYRKPEVIRFCVNPLYLTLNDLKQCVQTITEIITDKLYLRPTYQQGVAVP